MRLFPQSVLRVFFYLTSVTSKKSPNIYKSWPINDFSRKMKDFTTFTKNVGKLVKIIAATGFKKLPKVQKISQSGHTVYFSSPVIFFSYQRKPDSNPHTVRWWCSSVNQWVLWRHKFFFCSLLWGSLILFAPYFTLKILRLFYFNRFLFFWLKISRHLPT